MILKNSTLLLLASFLSCGVFGQIDEYTYKRELSATDEEWNTIVLPNEIFSKLSSDFSDIRVYGIEPNNLDTIEAPYILNQSTDAYIHKQLMHSSINESSDALGYYYTFELSKEQKVNNFHLDFALSNFDFRIHVEGSQNLDDWYSISKDKRVLSIVNESTNYQYTEVGIPDSQFRYYRLCILGDIDPKLKSSSISYTTLEKGRYRFYPNTFETTNDKEAKVSVIDLHLEEKVPVSKLELMVSDAYDYYRTFKIECLTDSIESEVGWIHNYRTLFRGTISSLENKEFDFQRVIGQDFRITIDNQDNEALSIEFIKLTGSVHELQVRISKEADYYLVYGNSASSTPMYDISRFTNQIPKSLNKLKMGEEMNTNKSVDQNETNKEGNKIWLWAIIIVIVLVVGGFTLNMLRSGDEEK